MVLYYSSVIKCLIQVEALRMRLDESEEARRRLKLEYNELNKCDEEQQEETVRSACVAYVADDWSIAIFAGICFLPIVMPEFLPSSALL